MSLREAGRGLYGSFVFSYVLGIVLIGALVYYAGVWALASNTRILDLLVDGGIVPLTDAHAGYGLGLPDLELYVASQDPIDWGLLFVTMGLFVLLAAVKCLQFHRLARFVGLQGSFGQHARAYIYGHGINRMLPFQVGDVASAAALEKQGASLAQGAQIAYLVRFFIVFEIVFFGLVALYYVGIARWLIYLTWAFIILGATYFFKNGRNGLRLNEKKTAGARVLQVIRALTHRPGLMLELALLSIFSFLIVDTAAYFVPQAFSGDLIFLHPQGHQVLLALLGGYLARLIPITPGGIGQFEWGFAATMYASGTSFIDSATVAVLLSCIRYSVGGAIFASVMLTHGVNTDLRRVFTIFKRSEPVPATPGEAV